MGRLLAIIGGYTTACAAAASIIPLTLAIIGLIQEPSEWLEFLGTAINPIIALFAFLYVWPIALLPSMVAIIYAEQKAIRSRRFYVLGGGIIGVVAITLWHTYTSLTGGHGFEWPHDLILIPVHLSFAIPGMFGGYAYWRMAGRNYACWHWGRRSVVTED